MRRVTEETKVQSLWMTQPALSTLVRLFLGGVRPSPLPSLSAARRPLLFSLPRLFSLPPSPCLPPPPHLVAATFGVYLADLDWQTELGFQPFLEPNLWGSGFVLTNTNI